MGVIRVMWQLVTWDRQARSDCRRYGHDLTLMAVPAVCRRCGATPNHWR